MFGNLFANFLPEKIEGDFTFERWKQCLQKHKCCEFRNDFGYNFQRNLYPYSSYFTDRFGIKLSDNDLLTHYVHYSPVA